MCGIFCFLNNQRYETSFIEEEFMKGQQRGPESTVFQEQGILQCNLGFHRLAINGLNEQSNQPFHIKKIVLICNGEIYNYKELIQMMNIPMETDSDCEIIIHLYLAYGIEQTLQLLDGVFSFVLVDNRLEFPKNKIFIARDPYGVRPLYMFHPKPSLLSSYTNFNQMPSFCSRCQTYGSGSIKCNSCNKKQIQLEHPMYAFASEIKCLSSFVEINEFYEICHFQPGTYSEFHQTYSVQSDWKLILSNCRYHSFGFSSTMFVNLDDPLVLTFIKTTLRQYFVNAVHKRVLATDRPIACLLSGGLDSSLVAASVNECLRAYSNTPGTKQTILETYSIGLEGSQDLFYAKQVATYLNSKHTEVIVTEEDFINAIPEVIYAIESYDTTTVRASLGNYLLGKYIKEHSDAKVIFNGDGSDELCGGYLYMNEAPNALEFDNECRRLLRDIHFFDVLRSDKCISSHGLEPRTPFLDRSFVQFYLSIPPSLRFHKEQGKQEKDLLRSSFDIKLIMNQDEKALLPDTILWRKKEAFSDGVSPHSRSLFEIIQDHLQRKKNIPSEKQTDLFMKRLIQIQINDPKRFDNSTNTLEKQYYRTIFDEYFGNQSIEVIPYYWMPRFIEATDPSARTLTTYSHLSCSSTSTSTSNLTEEET